MNRFRCRSTSSLAGRTTRARPTRKWPRSERFHGKGLRLVIMNPSLLLGPGDERLSSTKVVLDFLARKIGAVPTGGLSFVDARDAATAFQVAMKKGRHGERYLTGRGQLAL